MSVFPTWKHSAANWLETSTLAALFENRVEVIAVVENPHAIRMSNVVGHFPPPERQFSGQGDHRVSTAGATRKTVAQLRKPTDSPKHTITDRRELSQEYEGIIRAGRNM